MKFKAKAILFDRDGVIINSEYAVIYSVTNAFKSLGFTVSNEDLEYIVGRSFNNYKDYFLQKWDFDTDKYRAIQKGLFNEKLKPELLFKQTIEFINRLYLKNTPLGLTTSAGLESTMEVLRMAKIENKFKAIVTKEECTELKPYPEPYLKTTAKLGIDPKYCIAIEDSSLGVQAAKDAGLICIAFPNEFTMNHDLSRADAIVKSANEIENLIEIIK